MSNVQDEKARTTGRLTLIVSIDEMNLILEGLGLIPYARVYRLIDHLQVQARRQIESSPAENTNGQ